MGVKSFGSELSASRIRNAERCGVDIVTWNDIPNCSFDFINTEQVFEHLGSPLEVLRHLKRGLSERGVIKISVPDRVGLRAKLRRMDWSAKKGSIYSLNKVAPLEHLNCFTRRSLFEMADLAGMSVVAPPLVPFRFCQQPKPRSLKSVISWSYTPLFLNFRRRFGNCVFLVAKKVKP